MLQYLIAPPSWLLLLLVVIGLYQIYRSQIFAPPPAAREDIPNWPVGDLFSYLAPNDQNGVKTLMVGQVIKDQLALGNLQAWGTPVMGTAPIKISPEYWHHAEWTYLFLDSGSPDTKIMGGHEHTGFPALRRVLVNYNEARKFWPVGAIYGA